MSLPVGAVGGVGSRGGQAARHETRALGGTVGADLEDRNVTEFDKSQSGARGTTGVGGGEA